MEPPMHFLINGKSFDFELDARVSLLDLFREHMGLTGTKKGCNQGACGACTVLVDGERINACLALAIQYQDRPIITVEGLSQTNHLHPLQQALIEHDGFQCDSIMLFPSRRSRQSPQRHRCMRRIDKGCRSSARGVRHG
jgi:aerobic-type carbon monoxide dehydrogenase small subunit (CoxS/CutS family)